MALSGAYTTNTVRKPSNRGRQSLAANAYRAIYRNIISLTYEPGQHLEENQLVEQLGIGRTPVREALLSLSADLLVECLRVQGIDQAVEERLLLSQLVAVTDCTTDDAAQHVTASLVARRHPVDDQEGA